jgi:hypothetical protein
MQLLEYLTPLQDGAGRPRLRPLRGTKDTWVKLTPELCNLMKCPTLVVMTSTHGEVILQDVVDVLSQASSTPLPFISIFMC